MRHAQWHQKPDSLLLVPSVAYPCGRPPHSKWSQDFHS
nr:MAG TPA: hypothetical protein [Caudoviricetes sp.]